MPSAIYSCQTLVTKPVGPTGAVFEPIPGLTPLVIDNSFLEFGGTVAINLYLGYMYSAGGSFDFSINIIDTAFNNFVVGSFYVPGKNGLATVVSISHVYVLGPNPPPPNLVARWNVFPTAGVQILPVTNISFSATVFENED